MRAVVPKHARNLLSFVGSETVMARLAMMALASISKTNASTSTIVGSFFCAPRYQQPGHGIDEKSIHTE
jgi:hypothetical protein